MTQKDVVAVLNLKEGDILFINLETIQLDNLLKLRSRGFIKVPIVGVQPFGGQSVADCLAVVRPSEVADVSKA